MTEKSPAFQMYAKDFLSDENVILMNNAELGCYTRLMMHCWIEGSIPAEINKIAKLCREDSSAMAQLWTAISSCFSSAIDDPSRLIHPRLEKERKKQEEFKNERAQSGKRGAEARWNKAPQGYGSANGSAMKQPLAKNGSSSAFASSSAHNKKENHKRKKTVDPLVKAQAVEVLSFLNLKTERNYRPVNTNLDFIIARLESGVAVQDCKSIIAKKIREWKDNPKNPGMDLYLRPATLFNKTKFEQYLGELLREQQP